jgi:hypothetical protein
VRADLMSLNRYFMEHGHWAFPMPELSLTPCGAGLNSHKMTMNLGSVQSTGICARVVFMKYD